VLGYHRQLEEIMRLLSPRSSRPAIALSLLATLVACGGGAAPVLDSIDDQIVAVGADLTLTLRATDPDGDALSYSFRSDVPDLGERATIATTPAGTGLFRWRPLAADVGTWHFDFVASDGDHDTTVTVTIQVKSAVGDQTTPVFRQPLGSGTTLDLAVRQCLDLDVVVEDQDSPEVALTEEDPLIEGATLEVTSGLAAVWHWCPSREQIDAEDRYTLTLGADDGDNPKVPKNYLIVLRRPGQTNCPGTAPVVTHTPADESTVVDLTLDATITDDIGLKQPPLLYYSTTAPASPPDLAAMAQTTMVLISGTMQNGVWAADVPNPVADPAGRHRGQPLLRDRRQRRRRRHRHLRSRDPGPGHRHLPDAGHQPGRRGRPRPVRELLGRRAVRRRRRSLRAGRPGPTVACRAAPASPASAPPATPARPTR
jgi:hypothetical protein